MSDFPMPPEPAAPAPAQRRNGFGTAGFVLGLVGLIFAFIPVIGVVAWPLTILGLIFALIGTVRATRGKADNKGIAISGLVLSAVGLIICIVWAAAFSHAVNTVVNNAPTPVGPASIQDSGAAAAPVAPPAGTKHAVVLEVTTAAKSNVQWSSGFTVNKQDVVDGGKTWTQTIAMEELAYTTVNVTPVDYQLADKASSCKITVDGKKVAENANPTTAYCAYTP